MKRTVFTAAATALTISFGMPAFAQSAIADAPNITCGQYLALSPEAQMTTFEELNIQPGEVGSTATADTSGANSAADVNAGQDAPNADEEMAALLAACTATPDLMASDVLMSVTNG